jgi:hypothetical protein
MKGPDLPKNAAFLPMPRLIGGRNRPSTERFETVFSLQLSAIDARKERQMRACGRDFASIQATPLPTQPLELRRFFSDRQRAPTLAAFLPTQLPRDGYQQEKAERTESLVAGTRRVP